MQYISRILDEDQRNQKAILLCLLLVAFVIRLVVLIFGFEDPGDGPVRAIIAYNWSKAPYFSNGSGWPPGFTYLAGTFSLIVDNPLISTRILNLILGSLTVPLFYLLARRAFNHAAALFAASVLVIFPLHVGLSATSLTEVSFLFEIIFGTLLLIIASEKKTKKTLYISLFLLCLCWAQMTRYEAWLLMPVFPSYYFWKTRKISTTILITIILLIFPAAWLMNNYLYTGNFLAGIFLATSEFDLKRAGSEPLGLLSAVKLIIRKAISHLGALIPIAIIFGIVLEVFQAAKNRIHAERILYNLIFCIYWAVMLKFTMTRGWGVWDRYLVFGFVMGLPFAALPFIYYLNLRIRRWLGTIIFIAIISIGIQTIFNPPIVFVTREEPTEIKEVSAWLQKSSYNNDHILITEMPEKKRQSRYLPLYFPEISFRYLIVSDLIKDYKLQNFLKKQPSLLITRNGDEKFQARVEAFLKEKIDANRIVYSKDAIKVYDVHDLCCKNL